MGLVDHGKEAAGQGSRPELHIGLLWHTLFNGNLGVGALSLANAQLIARAAEKHGFQPILHFIGSRGCMDYGFEVAHPYDFTNAGTKALLNPASDLHRLFRRCDVVFDIGGGDSFSDIYGPKRYWRVTMSKFAAAMGGTPLVLSPQTIGPFFKAIPRRVAQAALQRAAHVFARDETSFAILGELGAADRSSLSSDVAFALEYRRSDKDARVAGEGRPIRFGLNVSSLLYRLDEMESTKVRLTVDYPALVHAMLDRLTADARYEVHLVAHVIDSDNLDGQQPANREDDYAVAKKLAQRYPGTILAPPFASPGEAKSYIANLDMFAGSRMHATIAAISSDTPVIPLGYSRKFNGLFGSVGYNRNIDLTTVSTTTAMEQFDTALAELPAIRGEVAAANAEARRRLGHYEAFLDQMIGRIAPKNA